MRKILNRPKIPFFATESNFSEFIYKLLKLEEAECFIDQDKFEMQPVLCKFPILTSTVKLEFINSFSQFIHKSKTGTFDCWSLAALPSFSQFTEGFENWDFWDVRLDSTFKFFLVH